MVDLSINSEKAGSQIIEFLKKTFKEAGFTKAVLGVSGGVDSALVLFLAARALGEKNVLPVMLSYAGLNSKGFKNAELAIRKAGIAQENAKIIDIKEAVEAVVKTDLRMDELRKGNIMVRLRMIHLYDLAKKHRALVLGTENRTEYLLGYFTRFGDEASDVEPIRHLYKTQVKQLAEYLGVPKEIVNQEPTAGMWPGQTDEGEFGFSYSDADKILLLYADQEKTKKEISALGFNNHTVDKVIARLTGNSFKHRLPYIFREKRL
ncbi:MAG: NH(3)-dependent NAD(+) synthetase, NAD+ synthase [Candidatus Gottesmanbacteria bacterium GW2011_GWA2_43_14]|uniref:NH(3)-dependent NAD(+) synthetase n=1 Tax=Candidatus Gottesmanbacteria bacterium GW2011_GWA2_43_14 TaxID=1618443 RepID=A0A0G1DJ72_9BACT|nr:MAG: NH(3)-dependent NAD(+) synthetase, NAD+ synthase [Candidatus Gottesmanbacteria bacterium GW2011_GWA2_43_14]